MITLYDFGNSVCCQKVRITLTAKELSWDAKRVDLFRSEQYSPEYLKLNPNGVVPDTAERLSPLRRATGILIGLIVVLVALVIAERLELLDNWTFAFAVVGVIVVASALADRARLLGAAEEPLEWVGVDRPYTVDDVRRLDAELGLERVETWASEASRCCRFAGSPSASVATSRCPASISTLPRAR